MNFNHLLTEREMKLSCRKKKHGECKWKPVSEGQATAGKNIAVPMLCETCGERTSVFMHFVDYDKHQKVISREVNYVKASK
tara:strand:- start:1075 stop:1317 length:243 start_codon:yes stop_codon:yes gene_type:complete